MENPCKIIFFGDSITREYTPIFLKVLKEKMSDIDIEGINAGVIGETSRDGLKRVKKLKEELADVIVISFGMNDWRKGVSKEEFRENILYMIDNFEKNNFRVILTTINPSYENFFKDMNKIIEEYNCVIRSVARKKKIKIADVYSLWKKKIKPPQRGLRDKIHPNKKGYQIYCESLMNVVPRQYTTILWMYNGREAKCNYRCPYCYYIGLHNPSDNFFGTIEQWHKAFKRSFRNQNLIFYLAHGEPMLGDAFYDIVEMIGKEPKWEMRMTSNVSQPLEKLMKTKLVKDGRLHINASFHPSETTKDKFLDQIIFLRNHGIEVPIIYVMYPPYLERFEKDFKYFDKYNFLVHVRRFSGTFKGKSYPEAYSDEEKRFIAKYCDDATIKYMLNEQNVHGKLSYSGMHFMVVDNVGNVGYDSNIFPHYSKYRCILGNILDGSAKPLLEPKPYPGTKEGTVDGVANLLKLNYRELEGNNVISFAEQGGVYKKDNRVVYKNRDKDFSNSEIRAKYNFPSRGIKDEYFKFLLKGKRYGDFLLVRVLRNIISLLKNFPILRNIIRKILPVNILNKIK